MSSVYVDSVAQTICDFWHLNDLIQIQTY